MIISCKTAQNIKSFTIGKGGGFTGRFETYLVQEDGNVYKVNQNNADGVFIKIDKKQIAEIFKKFEQLTIAEDSFSHPGNISSFIRYQADNKTYEIKWGSPGMKPPQKYADFFDFVWNIIRSK
jgi:hypothetical protein